MRQLPSSTGSLRDLIRRLKGWAAWRRAEVVLISPPGSGRTWLAAMISRYYHLVAGAPADRLIKQPSFYRQGLAVPRFFLGHPSQVWGDRKDVAAARLHRGKRSIFLIRDPRDAAISQVFHKNFRTDRPGQGVSAARPTETRPFRDTEQLYGKVEGVLRSLARIDAVAALLPQHLIVTYEGLRADPKDRLSDVLRFADREPDPAAVEAAVRHCGFDAMRERERQGQAQARALRAFDRAESSTYKARRGEVGAYASYLTAAERDAVDGMVQAWLTPRLDSLITSGAGAAVERQREETLPRSVGRGASF